MGRLQPRSTRTRSSVKRAAALAAITLVLTITAPACRSSVASGPSSQKDSASFIPVDPKSTSPTDKAIAEAQARLQANINDDQARVALAQAYLQKARETADPSLYVKTDGLLADVKKRTPKDPNLWITLGTLQLAQHKFSDALKSGKTALKYSSDNQAAYGVLVDANNELGNMDDALKATQEMADLKPNLAALSRVSYARELRGDISGAITAMQQAITAGGTTGENVAYDQVLLGGLLLTNNQVADAEAAYEAALVSFPGFAAAKEGQAKVLVARGKPSEAADILQSIINTQPLSQYAIERGDALVAAGRQGEASDAYALVDVINRLFQANGVNVDRELALFQADHSPGKAAISKARSALKDRGSLAGHDVLAWNLFRDKQINEASKESDLALSAGSRDPQERFHAAAIAMAKGDRNKAQQNLQMVLSSNPRFSATLSTDVANLASQLGMQMPPPAGTP